MGWIIPTTRPHAHTPPHTPHTRYTHLIHCTHITAHAHAHALAHTLPHFWVWTCTATKACSVWWLQSMAIASSDSACASASTSWIVGSDLTGMARLFFPLALPPYLSTCTTSQEKENGTSLIAPKGHGIQVVHSLVSKSSSNPCPI